MLLDTRTACYILMVLCRDLAIGIKSRSRATLHFRRYLYPPNTNTSDFLCGESLLRLPIQDQGWFCYRLYPSATQTARWKPRVSDNQIRVHPGDTDGLCHRNESYGDMRAHVNYRPAKVAGGLRCWLHINASMSCGQRPSRDIFISPSLFWGYGYHSSHATSVAKILHRTVNALIVNSRSIITEENFHDCGSASATSE